MNAVKKMLSLIICITLTVVMLPVFSGTAVLAAQMTGTVHVNDSLNVRSGPATSFSKIGNLYNGNTVVITDSTTYPGWYAIEFNGSVGYVSSTYITVDIVYEPSADFEAYMTSQGFPETYKPYLRQLHARHPNWVFTSFNTGLDWNAVIQGESKLGRSLVEKLSSYPDAYFSYQQGAYNFETGKHVVFDGTRWVQASEALIKYAVDPRNYLNDTYIFAFFGLSYSPNETVESINGILNGTFMSGAYPNFEEFATYADAFLAAGKASGVSSYHLASSCRQEQGVNGASLSKGTVAGYEGYYNFFNVGAYNTASASNVVNGAIYAKNKGWDTPYKSILGGAQFIANGYINVGQDTKYLHKFDFIPYGSLYTHQYMSNILAAFSEGAQFKSAFTGDAYEGNLTFKIPVFSNMPDETCPKPTGAGDNNYLLSSLSVDRFDLTPVFDPYTYSYELVVENSVTSVNVTGAAMSDGASVTGLGAHALNIGDNKIDITVTAKSGTKQTYTVTVSRQAPPSDPDVQPKITGTAYTVGNYVTGITPETDAATFISKLAVTGGAVVVTDHDGAERSGIICSGDKAVIYSGQDVYATYDLVIYGDINGDGRVSSVDLFMGQRYILSTYQMSGARLEAADINHDGRISSVDLFMGQRHILGTYVIVQ